MRTDNSDHFQNVWREKEGNEAQNTSKALSPLKGLTYLKKIFLLLRSREGFRCFLEQPGNA